MVVQMWSDMIHDPIGFLNSTALYLKSLLFGHAEQQWLTLWTQRSLCFHIRWTQYSDVAQTDVQKKSDIFDPIIHSCTAKGWIVSKEITSSFN